MALRDRIKAMGMFPDVGKLQDMFGAKFDQLIAKLDQLLGVLREILAELRTQRGGTP